MTDKTKTGITTAGIDVAEGGTKLSVAEWDFETLPTAGAKATLVRDRQEAYVEAPALVDIRKPAATGRGAKAKPGAADVVEQRPPSRFTELADREVLHLVRAIGNAPDGELAWLARRIEAARERVKHR